MKFNKYDLSYLQKKPRVIRWEVVAKAYNKDGSEKKLSFYETYDLIFDDYDLKIRQLGEYSPKHK